MTDPALKYSVQDRSILLPYYKRFLVEPLLPAIPQKLDPNANFVIEAEWGPNGAVCLNHANMRIGAQPLACDIPACGAGFASGGLIQSGKIVQ